MNLRNSKCKLRTVVSEVSFFVVNSAIYILLMCYVTKSRLQRRQVLNYDSPE